MSGRKWHNPEAVVEKLNAVRAMTRRGVSAAEAMASVGVSQATYYRWRAQYGSLRPDQAAVVRDLRLENSRLRRLLLDVAGDHHDQSFSQSS